jgi:hypothetical protein
MKKLFASIGLLLAFLALEIVPGGLLGSYGGLAWSVLLAVCFAAAASCFARLSPWFVVISVLFVTALIPLAVLAAIAYPRLGSTKAAASNLGSHLAQTPVESALTFLLPLLLTLVALHLFKQKGWLR